MKNNTNDPWAQQKWLPGVLNQDQMQSIIDCKLFNVPYPKNARQEMGTSGIDLHISNEGYKLVNGTIKPSSKKSYKKLLSDRDFVEKLTLNKEGYYELLSSESYLFKIKEYFEASALVRSNIHAQATAKSTIGRLDVIARLIVDGVGEYETMYPSRVITGEMYIEITPITFNIKVKDGDSLSQIRFFYGSFDDAEIKGNFYKNILHMDSAEKEDRTLSVDISPDGKINASAFVAKNVVGKKDYFFQISGKELYEPELFWDKVTSSKHDYAESIKIEKDKFYILRSKESICLPPGVAVYCRAMDETIGELRIHYAGFVHPFFGYNRDDGKPGTPLIFEIRGHNVQVNLTENEILARLIFYRMSLNADKPNKPDKYDKQVLQLSKIFKEWKE
jgi:dCTP deaminase